MEKVKFNPNQFKELNDLISKENNIETNIVFNKAFNTIWIRDDTEGLTELYLKSLKDQLIISRIGFRIKHKGIGTKVLNWLIKFAKENGFKSIMIESGFTPEIIGFQKKHNFKPIPYQCIESNGVLYGNYELRLVI